MTEDSSNADNVDREEEGQPGKRGRWGAAGLGAAIGSAAIVAALLYVKSTKGKDKTKS